jgi:hypothetical protein
MHALHRHNNKRSKPAKPYPLIPWLLHAAMNPSRPRRVQPPCKTSSASRQLPQPSSRMPDSPTTSCHEGLPDFVRYRRPARFAEALWLALDLFQRRGSLRLILKPETIIHAGFNDMDSAVG